MAVAALLKDLEFAALYFPHGMNIFTAIISTSLTALTFYYLQSLNISFQNFYFINSNEH
jgi:hypothetical protein